MARDESKLTLDKARRSSNSSGAIIDSKQPPTFPDEGQILIAHAIRFPPCIHIAPEQVARELLRSDGVFPDSHAEGCRIFLRHLNVSVHDVCEALSACAAVVSVGMLSHREVPDCLLVNRDQRGNPGILDACSTYHLPFTYQKLGPYLVGISLAAHGSGLGRRRWVVERTFAWLNQFRRLRVLYDKRAEIHEAFLSLGCALICWQSLRKTSMTG